MCIKTFWIFQKVAFLEFPETIVSGKVEKSTFEVLQKQLFWENSEVWKSPKQLFWNFPKKWNSQKQLFWRLPAKRKRPRQLFWRLLVRRKSPKQLFWRLPDFSILPKQLFLGFPCFHPFTNTCFWLFVSQIPDCFLQISVAFPLLERIFLNITENQVIKRLKL